MSESPSQSRRYRWVYRFLGGLLVLLSLTGAGCGVLGGGDDGDDENYPEPPGRPDAEVVDFAP